MMKCNRGVVEITPQIKISQCSSEVAAFRFGVNFDYTYPFFGGRRGWFLCKGCGHRVASLFQIDPLGQLRCRSCSGLVYSSQLTSGSSRVLLRAIDQMTEAEAVFEGVQRVKLLHKGSPTKRLRRFLSHFRRSDLLSSAIFSSTA